jgi:hypothetical protein
LDRAFHYIIKQSFNQCRIGPITADPAARRSIRAHDLKIGEPKTLATRIKSGETSNNTLIQYR